MIEVSKFVATLKESGVGFFTGVPDSLLKRFCAYLHFIIGFDPIVFSNDIVCGHEA